MFIVTTLTEYIIISNGYRDSRPVVWTYEAWDNASLVNSVITNAEQNGRLEDL